MNDVKQLSHRQRQALATQRLIVDAARDLFIEHGYGPATIDAISARAGVASSTIYAVFKNKRGILKAIREDWHQQSGQRDIYATALRETDPHRRIGLAAHATRRQWETGATMIAIYTSAAAVDAEAAAELHEALHGRRTGVSMFINATLPLLNPQLDAPRASAIYLALTRAELYQELVEQWQWTPDAYETWLADTLRQQLLPR